MELTPWSSHGRLHIPVYKFNDVKYKFLYNIVPHGNELYIVKIGSFNINEYEDNENLPFSVDIELYDGFHYDSFIAIQRFNKYYIFGGLDGGPSHGVALLRDLYTKMNSYTVTDAIN